MFTWSMINKKQDGWNANCQERSSLQHAELHRSTDHGFEAKAGWVKNSGDHNFEATNKIEPAV